MPDLLKDPPERQKEDGGRGKEMCAACAQTHEQGVKGSSFQIERRLTLHVETQFSRTSNEAVSHKVQNVKRKEWKHNFRWRVILFEVVVGPALSLLAYFPQWNTFFAL